MRIFSCLLIPALLVAQSLPWPGPGIGSSSKVSFLNAGTRFEQSGSSYSHAFSVTGGGTNVVAFATIGFGSNTGSAISAVTYAGAAMTSAGAAKADPTNNIFTQVFYKVNPATGSNTLAITTTGTDGSGIVANLVVFQGVNQSTPVRAATYTTANGNNASPTLTITSNISDLTLSMSMNEGFQNYTATNQTSDGIVNTAIFNSGSDHATTPGASKTHAWTLAGTDLWTIVGFSIMAA